MNITEKGKTKYRKYDKLGQGSYGAVYKCGSPRGGDVAIKCNFMDSNENFSSFLSEMDINMSLQHPYILNIKKIHSGNNPFVHGDISPIMNDNSKCNKFQFVYPLGIGDLMYYVKKNINRLTMIDVRNIMMECLLGLEYIHFNGYIHRDIKPGNIIMVNEGGKVKSCISDFGLSKVFIKNLDNTPGVCTILYRPPEILLAGDNRTKYDKSSDIWSLGSTFYEIITGYPISGFVDTNVEDVMEGIIYGLPYKVREKDLRDINLGQYTIDLSGSDNKDDVEFLRIDDIGKFECVGGIKLFANIITRMLQIDSRKRWTSTQLLDDRFFDPVRKHIEKIRKKYNYKEKRWEEYKTFNCIERKWMISAAIDIFNDKCKKKWFDLRALFQSISLSDRFLYSISEIEDKSKIPTDVVGRLLCKSTSQLYYEVFLYISIKYYSSLSGSYSFSEISRFKFEDCESKMNIIENFETNFISETLGYRVYHPTPYDIISNEYVLDSEDLHCIIWIVYNQKHIGKNPSEILDYWNLNKDIIKKGLRDKNSN